MKIIENIKVNEFVDAARAYCGTFGHDPGNPDDWVKEVLRTLSILYAAAIELPDCGLSGDAIDVPDSYDIPYEE